MVIFVDFLNLQVFDLQLKAILRDGAKISQLTVCSVSDITHTHVRQCSRSSLRLNSTRCCDVWLAPVDGSLRKLCQGSVVLI